MEDNLGINIFKFVVAKPNESNFRLACWLIAPDLIMPAETLHQFWLRVEGHTYRPCIIYREEASRILIVNQTAILTGVSFNQIYEVLEGKEMNTPEAIPVELQEIMDELHAKLEIAGEGLDLFHALKKVHKHIHENPENLLFLKDEQVAEIVRACEITQDLTIKTTAKKASKPKASNDLILADNSLDFGDTSGMSLKELMASKKK